MKCDYQLATDVYLLYYLHKKDIIDQYMYIYIYIYIYISNKRSGKLHKIIIKIGINIYSQRKGIGFH